ncbi:MAG: MG2 domain-containing protein [Caldilinea sp.]|nr:MG2 domain-containing protein [Caldilinea sp.]MDW8442847.1 alpha-2-macroglobulin family protein [Caldilineaceae bacterium]
MSYLRSRRLRILLPLFLLLFGCTPSPPSPARQFTPEEASLIMMGQVEHLTPGSTASFLVQVREPWVSSTLADVADRTVEVALEDTEEGVSALVFKGRTDENGLVHVEFETPKFDEPAYRRLIVYADTPNGGKSLVQDVYIGRTYNVLISTDKPVYQPGQTIHLRTLALDALDLRAAAGETVTVTIADPQGNKLVRQALSTSRFGVAGFDFPLDAQAPSGHYIITAEIGPNQATRTVEVKPYRLPRFKIEFKPDRSFYLPGETATGLIEAHYFFGKPVAGGKVTLRGVLTDVAEETVFEVKGETDAMGVFRYEAPVPTFLVGQLDNRSAQIDLRIEVVDTANHLEAIDENITVAEKLLLIDAVPESGLLKPGLANRVYLNVTTPDGASVQATLQITSPSLPITATTTTDLYGLAVITLTPSSANYAPIEVEAVDAEGRTVVQPLLLGGERRVGSTVLMRPERSEYKVGETANIDIFVNGDATTVYLDVIKGRQTFAMAALPVVDGAARAAIPIDGSLLGTLELNAYAIAPNGELARDRRLLLVNPAPAEVTVSADAEVYRPGDVATLDIQVKREGAPMPGVVGLTIVDESVFSVQEQDPGFARTYFLLERELQEPRYQIKGFVELEDDVYSPFDNRPDSLRYIAQARDRALAGLFAQELAAQQPMQTEERVAAPPLPVSIAVSWGNRLYLLAPLVGLALYDGSRKRRRLLIALTLFALAAFFWSACGAPAAPAAAPTSAAAETTALRAPEPPRLRQFFPETLYWLPELETDAEGRARVKVPIADSITTWRVSVLASDEAGNLGSAQVGLRVFQEFFVEPDLPRFLTVGDEIEAPVSVYNYLDEPQLIEFEVAPDDWYELTGEPPRKIAVDANEVTVVHVPIRVVRHGLHDFQITAIGSSLSDAVVRRVEVLPDGQQVVEAFGGRLEEAQRFTFSLPEVAIPETERLTVRIYPSLISQALSGLEGLLQTPYGCFEQTSSITYPNILVLDFLKASDQLSPELQMRAEHLIHLGYQRLLTFEVEETPGGFSLFGEAPAQMMITAFGLMEFTDMSRMAYVDPALIERVAAFLADRQNRDGSWDPEDTIILTGMDRNQSRLNATAYILWALADADAEPAAVRRGVRHLEAALKRALAAAPLKSQTAVGAAALAAAGQKDTETTEGTPVNDYTLALIANALIAADADAGPALEALVSRAKTMDNMAYWGGDGVTFLGGYGLVEQIETTAVAAQALLRSGHAPDLAIHALNYLIQHRDAFGAFHTTQATVQALRALALAARQESEGDSAMVTLSLIGADGKMQTRTLTIDADNANLVHQVVFEGIGNGAAELEITVDGDRTLYYQVVTGFYVPWSVVSEPPEAEQPMRIDVVYDRTELAVNETVQARVTVELLRAGRAGTVLVDLGVPPGFEPLTEDLDALVEEGRIDRYELTGRQIILYLTDVVSGSPLEFTYRLRARYPIRAQTTASRIFDYYAPAQGDVEPPQRIIVELKTPKR